MNQRYINDEPIELIPTEKKKFVYQLPTTQTGLRSNEQIDTHITPIIPDASTVCTGACKCHSSDIINELLGVNDKKHFKAAMSKYYPDKGWDSRSFSIVMAFKNAGWRHRNEHI